MELCERYGWRQVALLTEDGGQNYPAFHSFLKDLFHSRHIQVVYDRKMPRQASHVDAVKVRFFSFFFFCFLCWISNVDFEMLM